MYLVIDPADVEKLMVRSVYFVVANLDRSLGGLVAGQLALVAVDELSSVPASTRTEVVETQERRDGQGLAELPLPRTIQPSRRPGRGTPVSQFMRPGRTT